MIIGTDDRKGIKWPLFAVLVLVCGLLFAGASFMQQSALTSKVKGQESKASAIARQTVVPAVRGVSLTKPLPAATAGKLRSHLRNGVPTPGRDGVAETRTEEVELPEGQAGRHRRGCAFQGGARTSGEGSATRDPGSRGARDAARAAPDQDPRAGGSSGTARPRARATAAGGGRARRGSRGARGSSRRRRGRAAARRRRTVRPGDGPARARDRGEGGGRRGAGDGARGSPHRSEPGEHPAVDGRPDRRAGARGAGSDGGGRG